MCPETLEFISILGTPLLVIGCNVTPEGSLHTKDHMADVALVGIFILPSHVFDNPGFDIDGLKISVSMAGTTHTEGFLN